MQLTTARLKQIIKEELETIMDQAELETDVEEEETQQLNESLLNEDMNVAQVMLASLAGVVGAGSLAMIPMLVRDTYRTLTGSDLATDAKDKQKVAQAQQAVQAMDQQKKLEEAKKAKEAKGKMAAKKSPQMAGKRSVKNPYSGAASHKMTPMKKGK